jgi:1-acyl-sn-glycerol-3-phosphate acyltransferase
LGKALGRVYACWFYVVFVGIFLGLYPVWRWTLAKPSRYRAANRWRRIWAHGVFIGMGIPWTVVGEEHLDPERHYLFTPNHSSAFDIPLFALCWRGHYRFLAKKEWGDVPVFGIFFRTVDLMVDRASKVGAYKAYLASKASLEAGQSLVVYPEARMQDEGPPLHRFKPGPFRLAIETGVPIVPITFLDNRRLFPRMGFKKGAKWGRLRAIVHPPIEVTGMTEADLPALREQVFRTIEAPLLEAAPRPAASHLA